MSDDVSTEIGLKVWQIKLRLSEHELEAEKIRLEKAKIPWVDGDSLFGFGICLLVVCVFGSICFGCHKSEETTRFLAEHGYQEVGVGTANHKIVPLEKDTK